MVAEQGCSSAKTLLTLVLILTVAMAGGLASSTLDTRLFGKPKTYTNHREDWPDSSSC